MNSYVAPGLHLLVDFFDASNLQNIEFIEQTLRAAAYACNANVLSVNLHSFGENHGVTGVAVLAESHITIHTWSETSYIAIDIFMCGSCNPHNAIAILEAAFKPGSSKISEHKRGVAL